MQSFPLCLPAKASAPVQIRGSDKTATMMNIVRSQLLRRNPGFSETFGYETKFEREQLQLPKTHYNDAFVIAGGTCRRRARIHFITQKRKNNRAIQVNRNGQAPAIRRQRYKIQPRDIIQWQGKKYFAGGMQNKGAYLMFWSDRKEKYVKPIAQIKIIFHQRSYIHEAI